MKNLCIFAPAKINLFLHITGKRNNGYHLLDSLVAFSDIGDTITITPAKSFSFEITGAFANRFDSNEATPYINSDNLVVKAARALAQISGKPLNVKITLEKNLPLSSGIGGGSADAAATLWGLQELWGLDRQEEYLLPLMTNLGADVPVCLYSHETIMRGIGDQLTPASDLPEIPIILVNPLLPCPTENIFLHYQKNFKTPISMPDIITSIHDLVNVLHHTENDLYEAALTTIPQIENVHHAIKTQKGCLLSRMSGSGATCFGLFEHEKEAKAAEQSIQKDNPDWWVRTGFLNRTQRY